MRRRPAVFKALATCLPLACLISVAIFLAPQFLPDGTQGKTTSELPAATDIPAEEQGSSESADTEEAIEAEEEPQVEDEEPDNGQFELEPTITHSPTSERSSDTVLVQLSDDTTIQDLNESISQLDCVSTENISADDEALGWVELELSPGYDVDQALEELQDCDAIAESQPNYLYHIVEDGNASGTAAATSLASSGGSLTVGDASSLNQLPINDKVAITKLGNRWWLEAVGAYRAWKQCKTSGSVTVAVIDTGCSTSHEDLKKAVSAANCYNAATGATGLAAVDDNSGHGTHVCGIIAATPNNSLGIAGISYGARLMPVKVTNGTTSSTASLIRAYQFIMNRRAAGVNVRVVNLSMAGSGGYDPALMRAIDRAYYNYGILSVFAAGNDGEMAPYYSFPCDYSEVGIGVISVGYGTSTSLHGRQDLSSNYNLGTEKTKDLAAPGVEIVSTYPVKLSSGSPYGAGYCALTGTSMATPVVSGIAALVWARNPSLSPGDVKSILCSTAADIRRSNGSGAGFDAYTGYGLIRADLAVAGARVCYLRGKDAVEAGSTIRLAAPGSGPWRWSSSTTSVAKVSSTGTVKGISGGETVISATNTKTGLKLSRTIVVYEDRIAGKTQVPAGKKIAQALRCTPVAMCTYTSSDPSIASINSTTGTVTGKKVGTVTIHARITAAPHIVVSKKIKVVKGTNPMTVKGSTKTVSYAKLKKGALAVSGAIVFTKAARGKVTYAKVSSGSSARLTINKNTGAIKVKKGTPRGTYKIKVKVSAAGNASYKSSTRFVTVAVKVV